MNNPEKIALSLVVVAVVVFAVWGARQVVKNNSREFANGAQEQVEDTNVEISKEEVLVDEQTEFSLQEIVNELN